jgi:glycerophosphoryl diester phosphodiesterase
LTRDGQVILWHSAKVSGPPGDCGSGPDLTGFVAALPDAGSQGEPTIKNFLAALECLLARSDEPMVSDLSYSEVLARTAPGASGPKSEPAIPTLADLLAGPDRGLLDMDIKGGPQAAALVNIVISALDRFERLDRIVIEAPDLASARRLRAAFGSRVKLQVTPGLDFLEPYGDSLDRALRLKPHSISVPYLLVTPEIVDKAHRAGVEVWAWTVNSVKVARDLAALGVDAIKTDKPRLLARALSRAAPVSKIAPVSKTARAGSNRRKLGRPGPYLQRKW